ncbi:MAG TPA: hypothetical protein VFP37_13940 [Steroidobacteraceae bacterium]|nr:hypothetical protein [Steroidobacteraceae bacterium]
MKLSLDPVATAPRHVTAEAEALAEWYDAHPTIRRLWAIRDAQGLSVIVTLEPTMDNDDTYPAWFACSQRWSSEIRSIARGPANLELLDEPSVDEFEIDLDGEIVAAISWRDPTSFWKAD